MIETERLLLRPWREEDRPAFVALNNTPAMMEHLGGVQPVAAIDAKFDRRVEDQARFGHSFWAVALRGSGTVVGSCGVRFADDYRGYPVGDTYELGWRIAEEHWGCGMAREAASAAIGWTWAHTDAGFVAAWTIDANTRSWGLMERLGMTRRDELAFRYPHDGEPHQDLIVYTLDRPQ
jgi:RimJ/RimL family protein N-acetyltransferase